MKSEQAKIIPYLCSYKIQRNQGTGISRRTDLCAEDSRNSLGTSGTEEKMVFLTSFFNPLIKEGIPLFLATGNWPSETLTILKMKIAGTVS